MLYLNVDGLTNLAIAEGPVCRFTRVVGGGLEAMASELAERRGIALAEARDLLAPSTSPGPPRPRPSPLRAPAPAPVPAREPEASDGARARLAGRRRGARP